MKPQECCVLIPSLSPDDRLPAYVNELHEAGFALVLVVDDGSAKEYQPIFDRIAAWEGCHVLHHDVNHGKGQALRTGYAYIKEQTDLKGILTADSDGQHTVPDTLRLAKELGKKEELLLGSRDFSRSNKNVPAKSRFGNRMTSFVFRALYGHWLPDTQTGLRAFDRKLLDFMLSVTGDRFEYEMNVLIRCAGAKVPMRAITIETIYMEENKGTHFHPIRDSWRIYKLLLGSFLRYSAASIFSFLLDTLLVGLLMLWVFKDRGGEKIWGLFEFRALVAVPLARLVSAPVNFYLNRKYVFQTGKDKGAIVRYVTLAVCSLIATTLVFAFLDKFVTIPVLHLVLYCLVQAVMYLVNYRIQRAWVFPQEKALK